MPMLTTLRMRLPVCPRQLAAADRVGERRHPVEHRVHVGHDVDAVDDDPLACGRAQGDVQHRAILGRVDLLAAEHRVDAFAQAAFVGQLARSSRIVSSVTRFFE